MKRNSPGCRLLRVAIESGDWGLLSKNGFTAASFTEDAKIVYRWIDQYLSKHNELPSVELVEEGSGIELPVGSATDYAVKQFKDYLLRQEIKFRIDQIKVALNSGDIAGAASKFQPLEVHNENLIRFSQSREAVYEDYKQRKFRGIAGIEIPWPSLANSLIKWENSTLNVFLAPANAGKTWISCFVAHSALQQGHKVLFVSMENTVDSIQRRLAAIHYKIPFKDIRTAQADIRHEKRWEESLKNETFSGDILLTDRQHISGVDDVSNLNLTEKPDLVIIDGAYLLKGKGNSNWESAAAVLNQLQLAAKFGKAPWLCSSQLNPVKNKSATGYTMGFEARYAKEWMTNPDTSFILIQDGDDREFNKAQIKIAKIREAGDVTGLKNEFFIHTNRTTMDFSEIVDEEDYGIDY